MRDSRLCVIAYACEPGKGSEPEVGWRWSLALSHIAEVTVITRANNKVNIEQAIDPSNSISLRFEYIDLPKWAAFWKKGGRFVHVYYVLWQIASVFKAYALHRKCRFDGVMHVTFSPYYHSPLAALLPTKFIWGPVGAGEMIPSAFLPMFTRRQQMRELLRNFAKVLSRIDPTLYFCCFRASKIIAATKETRNFLPRRFSNKMIVEGQLGEVSRKVDSEHKNGDDFVFITSGRQEYWKGHILVLRAFQKLISKYQPSHAKLIVLSDGTERDHLLGFVQDNHLNSLVTFTGWLADREDTFAYYTKADVFMYASLFECGGYVVVEAMSCGLPVICVDLGGPGDSIDSSCGISVAAISPDQVVDDMAEAMYDLYKDREKTRDLSKGALKKIENWFEWEKKGERIEHIVQDVLFPQPPVSQQK